MSWSLQLQNGDFTLSGASLGTVVDAQKLTQDLRCALLQRMGTDDMHLTFGSLIDGGTTPTGQVVQSVIGLTNIQQVSSTVQSEIQRIAAAYQAQQLNRAKNDRTTYNRVSLTPGEVLLTLTGVNMVQETDALMVTVSIQTAQGESIDVAFPVATAS